MNSIVYILICAWLFWLPILYVGLMIWHYEAARAYMGLTDFGMLFYMGAGAFFLFAVAAVIMDPLFNWLKGQD